jgi:quercetin dioxygenase-like cupin family protein
MSQPEIRMGYVADVWVRQMHFLNAGDVEMGHTHDFDHTTLLASGALSVKVDGVVTEFKAPHMILIKAEYEHELTALEPNTVAYCVHAVRNTGGGDLVSPDMVPATSGAAEGVL